MIKEALHKVKQFLFYRKSAYVKVFQGPLAEVVLRDLARFCRANSSTFHENERVAGRFDGRREVWLRIQNHLNLSQEQLWELLGRPDLDE